MEETKEVSRERISSGFLKLDSISYQRGDREFKREIIHRGNAVAALLYNTDTEKYVFVKQFRPGVGAEIIEIIAGTMDVDGESAEKCIAREIEEETGYVMTACNLICSSYSSPGSLAEKLHIFQAITDGTKTGNGGGVGDEGIEIIEYTQSELIQNLGILSADLKTFIALFYEMESGPMKF
jgi:nudix-type nucleoside diphosphatase (YffH/AdpP family)